MKFFIAPLLLIASAIPATAFDRETTNALKACHDYVWSVPDFAELPNAAVSVFPGWENENSRVVFWNVYWDEPTVRQAGNCTVIDGAVEGFEDYTKLE